MTGQNLARGTLETMAPEILRIYRDQDSEMQKVDFRKADVFSLGVTLFMMVFKTPPFAEASSRCTKYKLFERNLVAHTRYFSKKMSQEF